MSATITEYDPWAMTQWDHQPGGRYLPGYHVGSEDEYGSHRRDTRGGWPYSVYRQGAEPGVTDCCICTGIQSLADAQEIARLLNREAGQ